VVNGVLVLGSARDGAAVVAIAATASTAPTQSKARRVIFIADEPSERAGDRPHTLIPPDRGIDIYYQMTVTIKKLYLPLLEAS
jgi:hypothetical protein